jgi:phosphoglycerol transferase
MVGYILSDSLRWSHGAMRGTSADWNAGIAAEPLPEQLVRVASAGFAGVWVDRLGYADGGKAEEAAIAKTARTRPIIAANGRYVFYPLRRLRARLFAAASRSTLAAVGDATVHPLRVKWDSNFYAEETDGHDRWRWTSRPVFDIRLENNAPRARDVRVTGTVATTRPTSSTLTVSIGRRVVKRLVVEPGAGTRLSLTVRVPHGSLGLHFASDASPAPPAADPRKLSVKLVNPSIVPVGVDRAVRGLLKAAT